MYFVKLHGDEEVQEEHQNANRKKAPPGDHRNAVWQETIEVN